MATGNSKKGLSASILAGSEEIFEFSCQPCSTENLHVEAVGYCQDCCDYLCDTCFIAHRKLTATKHHKMLDKSAMTKTKLRPKKRDVLTETCPKHGEKVLEYFCNDHSQICCSVCLTLNHISCSDKNYIPDICGDIASSQEYNHLKAGIDKLVTLVTNQQRMLDAERKYNGKLYSEALANIKSFREQINKLLDKLEEDAVRNVSSIEKENSEKIDFVSQKCKTILSEVNNLKSDLKQKETDGKNNQLFVTTKMSQDHVTVMNSKIDELSADKIISFSFHQDEKITQMISSLCAIWSLSIRRGDTLPTARYVREVNVNSGEDTKDCAIYGIAILTGNRMVVADYDNINVKLIDMKANKVTSCLSVSSKPFDIIETKPNQVAVALGNDRKIEILTVSDILTRSHTIATPGAGIVGLCYDGSNFITACQQPSSVKIIDMSGRTLNTFTTDNNGKDLLINPHYIAIGRNNDVIYVTDWMVNTVTCMTTGGHVISVYKHDMLKNPWGVAVDRGGVVYVCSSGTNTVHQVSPTGDLTRILLGQNQGLTYRPAVLSYSDKDDRLYIRSSSTTSGECNYIRLYQLE